MNFSSDGSQLTKYSEKFMFNKGAFPTETLDVAMARTIDSKACSKNTILEG